MNKLEAVIALKKWRTLSESETRVYAGEIL